MSSRMKSRSPMQDWHRLFVQAIMSRGFMSGKDVFSLVRDICEEFNGRPGFPTVKLDSEQKIVNQDIAVLIEDFFTTSNQALEKVQFQIKKGYEETKLDDTYMQCYALVTLEENEQIAKLQRNFSEPEMELLRNICQHIIEDRADKMDTENNLINLCMQGGQNSTNKKLSSTEAMKTVRTLISQGYLVRQNTRGQKGGRIALGARLLMELEGWMEKNVEIDKCTACSKPVVISVQCVNRSCNSVFHKYCVETKSKCTECRQPIKLDGVAAKR